jgi:hypothetical protein
MHVDFWLAVQCSQTSPLKRINNSTLSNQTTALWDAAIAYEWSKAGAGENATGGKYPYMLCNLAPNMTGYQRILMLAESFPDDSLDSTQVMYNGEEFMCELAHVLPSEAVNVEGDDFVVQVSYADLLDYVLLFIFNIYLHLIPAQPFMASMKVMSGTAASFGEELEAINAGNRTDYIKIINVVLCPGVHPDTDTLVFEEEWTDNLTALLLSSLNPSEISQNYYLTSDAYLASDLYTENQSNSSLFWKDILDTYQNSEVCEDVFNQRLIYSFSTIGTSPWVEIKYNVTGITENDVGCMLTLVLALSGLNTVCAVEIHHTPKILNTNAQWVMQTGEEGKRPFFDVGLDGEGQIVTVSDTGIDKDNCYFWDVDMERTEDINLDHRKVVQYIPFENDDDYYYGHGTHTAGTGEYESGLLLIVSVSCILVSIQYDAVAGKRATDGDTESLGDADG